MSSNVDKEHFVSGLAGATPWDVGAMLVAVVACAVCSTWLRRLVSPLVADVLGVAWALVLVCTVASDVVPVVAVAVVGVALVAASASRAGRPMMSDRLVRWEASTVYRGSLMMLTCICILAVDFDVFPRRFAKTERFGFSLMDAGVGMFMFSSGQFATPRGTWQPLLLGLVRLVVTSALGYHQHTSEYGTHWNFFLTIFVVHFVCMAGLRAPSRPRWIMGAVAFAALAAYQSALLRAPLLNYMLDAPRVSLLSHNREGILSCVGYCAIFLSGVVFRDSSDRWLAIGATVSGVACALTHLLVQEASRRLANAAYVLFIVSCNAAVLLLLRRVRVTAGPVVRAFSAHQLLLFLVANVATGAVNLSVDTLATSRTVALVVLLTYVTSLCIVAMALPAKTPAKSE